MIFQIRALPNRRFFVDYISKIIVVIDTTSEHLIVVDLYKPQD